MLSRRELIKLGLYGGAGGVLHLVRGDSGTISWALGEVSAAAKKPKKSPFGAFTTPLPLPSVKKPVAASSLPNVPQIAGATYYEVHMKQAPVQIITGPKQQATMIWGYDGLYLGPTFQAAIGETVVVRMHNDLPGVTAIVHHHGAHTPADSDGSALWTQQIAPGSYRDYVYPNDDDISATHWYHDHDIDVTGHNVFMGLEGCFLLHDATELALNLPGNPNDPPPSGQMPFDLPIVIQDRAFDANNQLAYDPFNHDGFVALPANNGAFLVNGAIQPFVKVANRKYRLRFLNGSNARFYQLSFSNGMPFRMIGSDGGLFTASVDVSSFLIGPAERWEAIVDFSALKVGTSVFLDNCMQQTGGAKPDGLTTNCTSPDPVNNGGAGSLMRFDIAFSSKDNSSSPTALRHDLPVYVAAEAINTRVWNFERSQGAWQINGQFYDPGCPTCNPPIPMRIDATVKVGTTEIWRLVNGGGGWYHPVHIHRNQFNILARNGQAPGPLEQGLKDVFVLEGGDTVDVITKYTGAAQIGTYVMHCHNVEHEDMRMMIGWNVVV